MNTEDVLNGKPRKRHEVGGADLAKERGQEAKRLAAAILEVLAGARTPTEAAASLELSLPRYYQLEAQALRGLLAACEPRPRGRVRTVKHEVETLRKENQRLQRELTRHQALARAAQRTIGLSPSGVMQVFMVQGSLIGVIGTILGVVGGVLLTLNLERILFGIERLTGYQLLPADVYYVTGLPTDLQGSDVTMIAAIALVMAFLATLYPAWRAARTAPAEALRYE